MAEGNLKLNQSFMVPEKPQHFSAEELKPQLIASVLI
jgi:hypothetical protein